MDAMCAADLARVAQLADLARAIEAKPPRRRRPGSVRFDPYLKIQWWDEKTLAWRDIQKSWGEEERAACEALAPTIVPKGARWRLMRISEEGREPLP